MGEGLLDLAVLRRLLAVIGGDAADLDELLDDFRNEAPELAARIRVAAAAGDMEALRIAAHTLKSNARDFGAMQLSALCDALERDCRAGAVADPQGAADAITAAEEEARRALAGVSASDIE